MQPLLYLDTESTDLVDGRAVEIAFAIQYPDAETPGEIKTIRCRPRTAIDLEAMAVHHITELDVINQPYLSDHPDYEVLKDHVSRMILVAHNAEFDIGVLSREGMPADTFIDTKRVAMHLFPDAKTYKLQYLRYYLSCNVHGMAHSAEGDVVVLIAVFKKIIDRILQEYELVTYGDAIKKAIELSTAPALLKLAPFKLKKWAKKPFAEINRLDRDYIEWAYKQKWDDEDLQHTLNHWIKIRSV